jgi:3-oxoadipate enol-lactonase
MTIRDHQLVAVDGAELEVFAAGNHADADAPVIVAAHPADTFVAGTAALLAAAAGNARVLCINPRGAGGSTPLPSNTRQSLAGMVDDLEAARQALALPPCIFWGISGGGWLGQLYAQRHPQALTHLILESICPCFRLRLADPACLASPLHPAWRSRLEAANLVDAHAHELVSDGEYEWFNHSVGAIFRRRGGPALLVMPLASPPPRLLAVMPELYGFDARAWLPSITTPTLVIAGSADPIVPVAHARALQQLIRGSQWLLVEGAGHVPLMEKRDEVTVAVRRFIGGVERP